MILKQASPTSHLFYAGDVSLFYNATKQEVEIVKNVLKIYKKLSSQAPNLTKLEFSFLRRATK